MLADVALSVSVLIRVYSSVARDCWLEEFATRKCLPRIFLLSGTSRLNLRLPQSILDRYTNVLSLMYKLTSSPLQASAAGGDEAPWSVAK